MMTKLRTGLFLLVWFIQLSAGQGQNPMIDSLHDLLAQPKSDSSEYSALAELAYQLFSTNPELSAEYAVLMLEKAEEADDHYWIARAHNALAITNQIQGNLTRADSLYQLALQTFSLQHDSVWMANVLNNIGLLESSRGRHDEAIINYYRNLEIRNQWNDSLGIAWMLNKIGKQYTHLGDYDKANRILLEALQVQKERGPDVDYPHLLINLAEVNFYQNNLAKSVALLKEAEGILMEPPDYMGLAEIQYLLGSIAHRNNNTKIAFERLYASLDLKRTMNDKLGIAKVQLKLAQIFAKSDQFAQALELIDSVMLAAYFMGAAPLELQALLQMADIKEKQGNYADQAQLYNRYIRLNDSLNSINRIEDMAKAENRYLLDEQQRRLSLLEQVDKTNRIKAQRNRILAGMLLILVIAVSIYSLVINRSRRTIHKLNSSLKKQQANLESLVQERTKELELALQHVVESDKLKSYFLANLSHEIRTPLNGILGFSDILVDQEMDPLHKGYIREINHSGEQLLVIIDRILQLSKLQAGSVKSYPGVFEPKIKLLSIEEQVKQLAAEFNTAVKARLVVETRSHRPVLIHSDHDLIAQVLLNLLHNAFKFTQKGAITYGMRELDNEVEFFVSDTGIGIRSEDIPKIFTPFDQVEDVLTKTHRGVGLGLPLSAQIIYLLESNIKIISQPGKGSTFYFRFPIYRAS